MKLQLQETKALGIKFSFPDTVELDGEKPDAIHVPDGVEGERSDAFSFRYAEAYNDEEIRTFVVHFDLKFESEHGFLLNVSYIAKFTTDEDITDDFKQSLFPSVNAPAIAYPFLRSFVASLTVNAGYPSVILPTVNFQALNASNKKEQHNNPAAESESADPTPQ